MASRSSNPIRSRTSSEKTTSTMKLTQKTLPKRKRSDMSRRKRRLFMFHRNSIRIIALWRANIKMPSSPVPWQAIKFGAYVPLMTNRCLRAERSKRSKPFAPSSRNHPCPRRARQSSKTNFGHMKRRMKERKTLKGKSLKSSRTTKTC